MLGRSGEAEPIVREVDRRATIGRMTATAAAYAWAAVGDGASALRWLEAGWAQLDAWALLAFLYPPTRPFFDTGPYRAFGRRMGIPRFVAPE
jgi:hypothetical protein